MTASEPRDIYLSALANNTASRLSSTASTGKERGVQSRRERIMMRDTFKFEGGTAAAGVALGTSARKGQSILATRPTPQSPRGLRYSARVARKSSSPDLLAQSLQQEAALRSSSKRSPKKSIGIFSPASYSALVTISIALLAWSFISPAAAALSCDVRMKFYVHDTIHVNTHSPLGFLQTNADCSVKGLGTCKHEHNYGASTCGGSLLAKKRQPGYMIAKLT